MRAYALVFALVASIADAQPALRERMLLAEDQRASTDTELATLKQGLRSADAPTRRQAVRAIGRLERADLLPFISPLLTDRNTDVRVETINAVGQLARGEAGLAAARSRLLARARAEQTPRVRGVVATTLGRLPYTAATDVQQVERVLAEMLPPASKEQQAAVVNLDEIAGAVEGLEALIRQSGKISPPAPNTIDRLRSVGRIEGRAEDADTLARIRKLARAALIAAGRPDAQLLELGVADANDEVRRLTMIAVRADVQEREAILRKGLVDSEPRVRYEALQTWGRTLLTQSCDPVLSSIKDSNAHVRLLAIDLLGNTCTNKKEDAVQALRTLAETIPTAQTSWHAPAHALVALAKLAAEDARKLLPLYTSHPLWQPRMYAAQAAGRLPAIEALVSLGRDAHPNVREAALNELIALQRPEAIDVALDALTRNDYQLVITASRALAVPAAKERAVPPLIDTLARITAEKRETSRDARMAILQRLEDIGGPDSSGAAAVDLRATLPPYLTDFDPAIAAKTAEILRKRTQKPVVAAPKMLSRPAVTLRAVDELRDAALRFVMRGRGTFDIELLMDEAPLSALHVATRAREGYYNGLTFHRVVPNFVIQGGSPGANEYMGDGPFMRDEVGLVPHNRGAVGISTRGRDTGDAQIFVDLVDLPRLDHTYTVFGRVVAGMDIVDAVLEGDVIDRVEVVNRRARTNNP